MGARRLATGQDSDVKWTDLEMVLAIVPWVLVHSSGIESVAGWERRLLSLFSVTIGGAVVGSLLLLRGTRASLTRVVAPLVPIAMLAGLFALVAIRVPWYALVAVLAVIAAYAGWLLVWCVGCHEG